jgi:hypothetical protein
MYTVPAGACMKPGPLLLIGAIVSFCGLTPSAVAQAPARTPSTGTLKKDDCSIAGMVVKLAGSAPLRKATVQLDSADDRTRSISTSTDVGGRFQLKGLEPGGYRLTVMRNGFVTQEYGQKTPNDPGSALTLRPGQDLNDLLFRLIPSAVIAGRVIDEDGEPVPHAQVSALHEVYYEGKRKLSLQTTETTNDLGEYRLFGLIPGRYFIRAIYKQSNEHSSPAIRLPPGQSTILGYAPTYYPGSPDPAKALSLTVKAGEEMPSTEILFRPVSTFSVRGRIYNMVSRRSNTGVMIQLETRDPATLWDFGGGINALQNSDGTFEIQDVVPGSYTLVGYWSDEGRMYQARQLVEVGNADLDGVALTITPGIAVSGHMRWDGQPSLSPHIADMTVSLRAAEFERGFGGSAKVSGDTFTLKEVSEGIYRLTVFGQSRDCFHCFLKSVRFGGIESLDDGFTVRRGVDASLEVTISSRGARIQGSVTDADNLPAAGVWVVLIPDEPRRKQFRLYKDRTTDQYGHFDLRGVAPGNYKLFSWERVERGEWEDPEFLKAFEDKGERITVQEGEGKSANLAAIQTASTEEQKP